MLSGGSRRIEKTSCCSIFLWHVIIAKEKHCALTGRKIKVKDKQKHAQESSKTYESRASNISKSEVSVGADSPGASFRAEVLEEINSSRHFLFLSRLGSSEKVGGGNKVDPLSSWETLASSPSWSSSASGASEEAETGSA
jgi:hypothetical protein